MKMLLMIVGVVLVSFGGSLAVNHFPVNLLLTVPGAALVGFSSYMKER